MGKFLHIQLSHKRILEQIGEVDIFSMSQSRFQANFSYGYFEPSSRKSLIF